MTDSEREEFVYDLASYYVTKTTKAGLVAMAIDRMSDILLKLSNTELLEMAPHELVQVTQKTKDHRNKAKPKGF
jgi:hypothetical protein